MPHKKRKQYRLPGWDYRAENAYFITICTKDKLPHLGDVALKPFGVTVVLSPTGYLAKASFIDILDAYPHMKIDNWQIMPDHVHLILNVGFKPDVAATEEVRGFQALSANSVSSAINHYKGNVTKACKLNGFTDFQWQERFHDRVIRDKEEYDGIFEYIDKNPEQWLRDRGRL